MRWGLVVATMLAMALIVTLRRQQPSFDEKTAPMLLHASAGEQVAARSFSVRVGKLKLARHQLADLKGTQCHQDQYRGDDRGFDHHRALLIALQMPEEIAHGSLSYQFDGSGAAADVHR